MDLTTLKTVLKYFSGKIFIILFTNKKDAHTNHLKIPLSTEHNCCNKEKDVDAKCRT